MAILGKIIPDPTQMQINFVSDFQLFLDYFFFCLAGKSVRLTGEFGILPAKVVEGQTT